MASILKEIRFLEVGHYSNSFSKELYTTAASLHTAARIPIAQWEEKEPVCTYCKGAGAHTANQCTVIKGHQQCVSIIKEAGLYFNCLVHHRVSQCTYPRRCKQCNQKHHTSLCPPTDAKPPLPPSQMNDSVQPTNSTSQPLLQQPTVHNCQDSLQWLILPPHLCQFAMPVS